MVQTNRGSKRQCGQCGASYYDLNRTPVICPKCHAEYVAPPQRLPTRSSGRAAARAPVPVLVEETEDMGAFVEDEVLGTDVDEEDVVIADEEEEVDEEPDLHD